MRKRKLPLEKKLSLSKETVAMLNAGHQQLIAGGMAIQPMADTVADTCATIPPGKKLCVLCQS
ncbi:class I lanthipeptide [Chitinophaga sp. Cy-1792]|uniref:class I lanthipeptide n=1 Tax=Chitinophaga sp. Cy-1792 TaxID=2608339 RepID=UPI001424874C|nr:class I lanthipeptide [Chitinophaga sp. Cy-1792]NIG54998.1 hypothetical protein [Chitinophaga sp. Cy-1792]